VSDPADVEEIRQAYRRRATIDGSRYSLMNPGNLLNVQERERVLVRSLHRRGFSNLGSVKILEVGCGSGNELARLVSLGATTSLLSGVDLRPDAIALAGERVPGADLRVADAAALPYPDGMFDIVCQFTALSSMRSAEMRQKVATEMVRVARPGGVIVSYDFQANPRNRDTVGIGRREIARLFPGRRKEIRRVTLLPPAARWLGLRAPAIASWLAKITVLRTHLIAFVDV
jgi:ubiquinone/menaquinone biosynthesis C-methylase UbiE